MVLERVPMWQRHCSGHEVRAVNRTDGGLRHREWSFPPISFAQVHFTADIKVLLVEVSGFHTPPFSLAPASPLNKGGG